MSFAQKRDISLSFGGASVCTYFQLLSSHGAGYYHLTDTHTQLRPDNSFMLGAK